LSVHLGAFLLLRVSPLLDSSPLLSTVVALVGVTTAVFAYLAGSVQTDIKSALSFASLSQVGIIVTEIGLGFRYVALIHMLGHACLRALQFVRAPTLLHDYVAGPIVQLFRWFDGIERRWTDFLAGESSRESAEHKPHFGAIEEFS